MHRDILTTVETLTHLWNGDPDGDPYSVEINGEVFTVNGEAIARQQQG